MAVTHYSKKLFYDEWAYKIRLKMPTGYNQYIKTLLRYTKESTVESKLQALVKRLADPTALWPYHEMEDTSQFKMEQMCEFIRHARKKNMIADCRFNEYWRLISIYTNNKEHVRDIEEKFDAISVLGFFDYVEDPVRVLKKLLHDASKEIYISIPDDKGFLAWQRKVRYKRRNCPLYLYSKDSLERHLKDAGCLEMTEIVDTERGFYLIIRKQL